jgi:hypothetical protein
MQRKKNLTCKNIKDSVCAHKSIIIKILLGLALIGLIFFVVNWINTPPETELRPAGYRGDIVDFKPEVTIEITNQGFKPSKIVGKAGESVLVKVISKEGSHNFKIDELGISSSVLSQDSWEMLPIIAPADSAGQEYKFYSSVGDAKEDEISGILVIK